MSMTLNDLIEQLQEMADEHGGGTEVRLATQPAWPFEWSISSVVAAGPGSCAGVPDEGDEAEDDTPDELVVYLAEGTQLGYLPGAVSSQLGWRG